jgi:hypothetical protein
MSNLMSLDDFTGKMLNIRANAFMKLVAIMRFHENVPISGKLDLNGRTIDLSQMEAVRTNEHNFNIRITELSGDITRTLVNESYMAYERYLTVLHHGQPEALNTDAKPREFIEKYRSAIDPKILELLNFCRLVRNGLLHYEVRCSFKNVINYNFLGMQINTAGKEGDALPISVGMALSINEEMAIAVRQMIVSLGIDHPVKFKDFNGR